MWCAICTFVGAIAGFIICCIVSANKSTYKHISKMLVKKLERRAALENKLISEDNEYSEYHDGKHDGIKVAISVIVNGNNNDDDVHKCINISAM